MEAAYAMRPFVRAAAAALLLLIAPVPVEAGGQGYGYGGYRPGPYAYYRGPYRGPYWGPARFYGPPVFLFGFGAPVFLGPPVVYAAPPPPVYVAPAPTQVYVPPPPALPAPYCREYQATTTIGGQPRLSYGTACLQPDGSWKMMN